jgi:steroid delta-isomerase-like uncharacterized protein
MTNLTIKEIAIEFTERIGCERDMSVMASYLDDNMVYLSPLGITNGRNDWTNRLDKLIETFPDLRVTVDYAVVDGDRVALHTSLRGTQTEVYAGIPPEGRKLVLPQIMLLQFKDHLIRELEVIYDSQHFLDQLGGDPQPYLGH